MSTRMRRVSKLSSWRKLAMANWRDPKDPTVYGTLEVDAQPMLDYIQQVRERHDVKVTITHLVGRAVAQAVARYPQVNARVSFGGLQQRDTVDIFFQVATEGGADLSGAKVDGVEAMSAVDVARELSRKAQLIRDRKDPQFEQTRSVMKHLPTPILRAVLAVSGVLVNDLDLDLKKFGLPRDPFGSAMVTNVGGFDLETGFAPLVPMSKVPLLILVGTVRKRPVVQGDEIVVRPMITLCATFDHRLMDGFQAGKLARALREYLADPGASEPE